MKPKFHVNLDAIAAPGETENEMIPPAAGDRVQIMVEGQVTEVRDGIATVVGESGNGEPFPDMEEPKTPDQQLEDEEAALRRELDDESAGGSAY